VMRRFWHERFGHPAERIIVRGDIEHPRGGYHCIDCKADVVHEALRPWPLSAIGLLKWALCGQRALWAYRRWQTPSQAYFWTEEWQANERQADEDFAAGRTRTFDNVEDAIVWLGRKRG
jgi:hypothetical protein